MSGKYNTQHPMRGKSRYPERLRKRDMTNVTVRMDDLDVLRRNAIRSGLYVETLQDMGNYPAFNGKRNNWRRRGTDEG